MKNISQTDNLTICNAASFIPILSFFNNYISTPLKLCSQLHSKPLTICGAASSSLLARNASSAGNSDRPRRAPPYPGCATSIPTNKHKPIHPFSKEIDLINLPLQIAGKISSPAT